MKLHIKLIVLVIYFFPNPLNAQTDFKKGFVITTGNEKIEGSIKESFRAKGCIIFSSFDNKKKIYNPLAIKSFSMDGVNYISYCNDFYEEVVAGTKANLYRKVTDNKYEKMYNGNEVIGFVKTTVGKPGDFYLLLATETKLDLITKANFKNYFIKLSNANDSLISRIKDGSVAYSQIKTVVDLYNNK